MDDLALETPYDPRREWKLYAAAIPAAFLIALVFHAWETGHFLQRTFLTMVPHELGHAITGWFCGFASIPTLWRTTLPEDRGLVVFVIVAAPLGFLIVRGWSAQRWGVVAIAGTLFALQLGGTWGLSREHAYTAFTFGGDAGAMVIGTLLVLAFFAPPGSRLRAGGLRFGLLAIGAAALVDTFATWWTARRDPSVIPYGEIEGVGLSDPSKLVETHGWSQAQLVGRYVTVGVLCILVITGVWAWMVWRTRRAARET